MKILIIGDIFGYEGKEFAKKTIPLIKEQLKPDITIANAENVSKGGKSLIKKDYDELNLFGVDYFTMGNHTFRNPEINDYIDEVDNLIRPINYSNKQKGKGYIIIEVNNKKILLLNILGKELMNIKVNNPFNSATEVLDNNDFDLAIIDFHAETTSEKIVLANYLSTRYKNKGMVFVGTHTHVQTSDERILNDNMAYITDLGMTGIQDSAIGMDFESVTKRMVSGELQKFVEASGENKFKVINGVLVTLYDNTLKPYSIERITYKDK